MLLLNKLAIIAPSRLGDTIFITPLLRFARQCYPDAQIDVFTMSELSASVLSGSPYIDRLDVWPTEQPIQSDHPLYLQYDVAFSAFEVSRTQSIAKALAHQAFISPPLPQTAHRTHEVLAFFCQALDIAPQTFDYHYELFPSAKDDITIQRHLERLSNHAPFLVGLHIGCHQLAKSRSRLRHWWRNQRLTQPHKAWPVSEYETLIALCHERYQHQIQFILTGTEHENHLAEPLLKQPNVTNLIGQTDVLELASLMDKLKLYITGDTGSLHVACASQVHVIGLFGPTNELITGPPPGHFSHTIIRQGQCVNAITPEHVLKELDKHLTSIASTHDSHIATAC